MKSTVVVCTRNRPDDLERLFESYSSQQSRPPLLVVDSSDSDATERMVGAHSLVLPEIRYLRAERGLTRQRMAGVRALAPDVALVHFIDDDVVLEAGYFREIERVFSEHDDAVGVGGCITNLAPHNPWWFRRLFLLDTPKGGAVLKSGINVLVFSAENDMRVQWLSGCAMSYRASVFDSLSFDQSMEGYSLGEDVEFSYRAGLVGSLWITPGARLAHLCSPVERHQAHRLAKMEAIARHKRVRSMSAHGLSVAAFWWSVLGDVLLNGCKGVFQARRYPLRRAGALISATVVITLGSPSRLSEKSGIS